MKELGVLLASCLVYANAQIIFPDEYAVLKNSQVNEPSVQALFPTVPSNGNFGFNGDTGSSKIALHDIRQSGQQPILAAPNAPVAPIASSSLPVFSSPDNETKYWSNHVKNLIARGVIKFTLDMDDAIHRTQPTRSPSDNENIIFSPLSLVGTLSMVLLGSAGVTFDQVARILGLEAGVDISGHSEIVHQIFGLLFASVEPKPNTEGPRVTMASGIFVQNGYPIRPEFRAISEQVYKSEVINIDFIAHANQARQTINDWVKARTNGKIKNILTRPLDPNTKLILASALYFNGEWNRYFIRGQTRRKPFMVTPTQSISVDMMYNGGNFPFYEDRQLGIKIVALPYKGYDLASSTDTNLKYQAAMYILLPTAKGEDALSKLKNSLTPEILDNMIGKMVNQTCILGLPRMKLTSNLNLNQALHSLGLSSLFDPVESNLGLLTPGYNAAANREPSIFTRIGEGDENNSVERAAENRSVDLSTKNNYFRYEDKHGYTVKQWDTGFIIEKIRRSFRRKRSPKKSREEAETYELPHNSTDRVKVVAIGENKYKFDPRAARSKRQSRPIDDSFVRFLQSRDIYSKYGLDTLRNSYNISNPGLFASDVLHKVEMDVTETGTIGAAATSIILQRGNVKRLIAERPFLFFIRHEVSKMLLFWGKVNKPTPNY